MSSDAFARLPGGRAALPGRRRADGVRTESVAWGLEQTLQTALDALRTR